MRNDDPNESNGHKIERGLYAVAAAIERLAIAFETFNEMEELTHKSNEARAYHFLDSRRSKDNQADLRSQPMKLSDVEEVTKIGEKLKRIESIHEWLDNFPLRGLHLDANGHMEKIEISQSTSRSLLDEVEAACLVRLKELGVES